MASQAFNHSNVYVYPNPIPIDGYVGRAYATRAATRRNVLGNTYSSPAVVESAITGISQPNRTVTEIARIQQTSIDLPKAASNKKDRASERVRHIRLMIIVEAVTALCLYGIWQLWHMIH